MQRVVAIDRIDRHLRYVIADIGARSPITIRSAGSLTTPEDTESVAVDLGARLRDVLAEQKALKAKVLFGLGRGSLDTVELSVPAAEDDELPSMVRNLTMRELSHVTEDSALDFLSSSPRPDGSRDVTAMVIREEVRSDLEALATATGIEPSRLLVRPYELRAFVTDAAAQSQVILAVSSSPQMVDVLLTHPEGGSLARSIRTAPSASPSAAAGQIVNEIRRTLISLPVEDFDASNIDRVLLLAGSEELQSLATELGTALDAQVQRTDPFDHPDVSREEAPTGASQYAPLVAMLVNEFTSRHPIDFLNPRRPPAPANRRKVVILSGVAVAALVAGAFYLVNAQFAEIDAQNAQLAARVRELKGLVKDVQPKLKLARALSSWESSRISWLDELRDLTMRMPSNQDLTVQRFSASPSRTGTTVTFSGESRSPEVVARMEQSLRDKHHQPKTPGVRERPSKDRPVWTFQTTMTVQPRSREEYQASDDATEDVLAVSPAEARVPDAP